jgi:hypothetical protein
VTPVTRPLEFEYNEMTFAINTEKVDTPSSLREGPELLGNDQDIFSDRINARPQETLQVCSLKDPFSHERGRWQLQQRGGHVPPGGV